MQYCGFGTPSVKVTVYGQKGCRVHPVSTPEMDGVEGNQNRKSILSFCNLTMTLLARYSTERTQLWNGVSTSTCQHIQYNKNGRQTSRMLWGEFCQQQVGCMITFLSHIHACIPGVLLAAASTAIEGDDFVSADSSLTHRTLLSAGSRL